MDDFERMIGRPLHYDREGNPLHWENWALEFEFMERHVAETRLTIGAKPITISTVWLGMDHGFGMTEKPLIFETMVFGGPLDDQQWRYATEEEARAGHNRVVDFHSGWRNRLRFRVAAVLRGVLRTAAGIVWVNRRPRVLQAALINVAAWLFAFALAGFGALTSFLVEQWWSMATNTAFAVLDAWMLRHAVAGLLWRRQMDREHPPEKRKRGRRRGVG